MNTNDLTEYLKKAFEYKNSCDYKKAIDYFYKALALDEESSEIMTELALSYSKLLQYDRAISFYEQILLKNPNDNNVKYLFADLLKSIKEYSRAAELFEELYNNGYEITDIAEELFEVLLEINQYEKIITLFNDKSDELNTSIIYYYVALAYSKNGNDDVAEEYYNKSFNADENNIDAGINIAFMLLEKGQVENAQQLALKLLKISENDRIFYLLAEISYMNSKIDSSIEYYSYAIKFNPQNAEYFFKLAIAFSIKGFFKEAEESYCRAIALDEDNEIYNYALAYMYYLNKKYTLSEKLTDFILQLNPDNYQALTLKAMLLINKDKVANAGKLIEEISENSKRDDFSYYVEAIYYSKLNMWENALNAIQKAIGINEKSIDYKYEMAKFTFNLYDLDKAKKICEEIINENPKYVPVYLLLAEIYIQKQDYEKAMESSSTALKLDSNLPEVYAIIGIVSMLYSDYEKALTNYKIALSMTPANEEYYARIAECYFMLENYQDSYSYFKEASNFDITNAQYRYYMAKCSIYNNDTENAIANFAVMKRLAPSNIEYVGEYADYLTMLGQKKKAITVLESTLKMLQDKDKIEVLKKNIKNLKKNS